METQQLNIFEGRKLRDEGIQRAIDNAENNNSNWAETAYSYLLSYMEDNKEFMAEEVRVSSEGIVPEPPHNRAWGGIFVRAKKNNLIRNIGFRSVKNPKAHCAPCNVWEVVNK